MALVERALSAPGNWIVADQVYFELYRLVRNQAVLRSPLTAGEAAGMIDWYRMRSGWLHCAYESPMMTRVADRWSGESFSARTTFDLVLAVTLAANGVDELFTRNTGDFSSFDLFAVRNPID